MSSHTIDLQHGPGSSDLLRSGFHVETEVSEGHAVVRLQGDLDMATTAELRRTLRAVLEAVPAAVTVDLRQLDFIDSTGIGALVAGFRRAGGQGCAFTLRFPSRPVLKALHLTGVDQMMHIEPPTS